MNHSSTFLKLVWMLGANHVMTSWTLADMTDAKGYNQVDRDFLVRHQESAKALTELDARAEIARASSI